MIGIYKITNKINSKCYIGQSINIERRFIHHKKYRYGFQNNKVLYKAIQKYGIDNFDFEIIEECLQEELDKKEKYYIEKYNAYYNGYNMTKGGDGKNGYRLTQESIEKMKKSLKEHYKKHPNTQETKDKRIKSLKEYYKSHPEACNKIAERNKNRSRESLLKAVQKAGEANRRKVYQYDVKGNFIKEHISIISASKEIKCSPTTIAHACKGQARTAFGFVWSYEYNGIKINAINPKIKIVLQYDLDNNLIRKYHSTREAERESGIAHNYISECCRGKKKQVGGFKWAYEV